MSGGTFELSIFVDSISSTALEKHSFYTVVLCAGISIETKIQKKYNYHGKNA